MLVMQMLIHLAMFLLTCLLTPYIWRSLNAIKIIGDFLLFLIFLMLIIEDSYYQATIATSTTAIPDSTINIFNDLGWTIMILVFVFNLIYFIKIFIGIYWIIDKFKQKKAVSAQEQL